MSGEASSGQQREKDGTVIFDKKRKIDWIDCLVILTDVLVCVAMPFYNKFVYVGAKEAKIPYPIYVTALQFLVSVPVIVGVYIVYLRIQHKKGKQIKPFDRPGATCLLLILPACFFTIQISADNVSLVNLPIYLHSLLRLTTAFCLPLFQFLIFRTKDTLWLILTAILLFGGCIWITAEALIRVGGAQMKPAAIAVGLAILSAVFAAVYIVSLQMAVKKLRSVRTSQIHYLETSIWVMSMLSILLILGSMLFENGFDPWIFMFTGSGRLIGLKWGLMLGGCCLTSIFKFCGFVLAQRNPAITTGLILITKTTLQTVISLSLQKKWASYYIAPLVCVFLGAAHYLWLRLGSPGSTQLRRLFHCRSRSSSNLIDNEADQQVFEKLNACSSGPLYTLLSPRMGIVDKLSSHAGVIGVLVVNSDAVPIRSTMSPEDTQKYTALVTHLAQKAGSIVEELFNSGDSGNDEGLRFIRVRSDHHEILVAPDSGYLLVVVQKPVSNPGQPTL